MGVMEPLSDAVGQSKMEWSQVEAAFDELPEVVGIVETECRALRRQSGAGASC